MMTPMDCARGFKTYLKSKRPSRRNALKNEFRIFRKGRRDISTNFWVILALLKRIGFVTSRSGSAVTYKDSEV